MRPGEATRTDAWPFVSDWGNSDGVVDGLDAIEVGTASGTAAFSGDASRAGRFVRSARAAGFGGRPTVSGTRSAA